MRTGVGRRGGGGRRGLLLMLVRKGDTLETGLLDENTKGAIKEGSCCLDIIG